MCSKKTLLLSALENFNDSTVIRAILEDGLASKNFKEKALFLVHVACGESGYLPWWPQSGSMCLGISLPECKSGIQGYVYPGADGCMAVAVPAAAIAFSEYESSQENQSSWLNTEMQDIALSNFILLFPRRFFQH